MMPPYSFDLDRDILRWRKPALAGGIVLLIAAVIGAVFNPGDFFHGYLLGYLFWVGLTLGSMAFLMLQYLTGGAWGLVIRRTLEAATRTLPLLAVLFIPLAFGLTYLYDWARPDVVMHSKTLLHRRVYMNVPFFLIRAAIYFAVWITFSYFLNRWSADQDRHPGNQPRLLARLSAPGLIVYTFTITFASVDWAESLQTAWYSTMWGFLFVAGEGLTALAFVIITMALLSKREPMSRVLKPDHFHDLGKLLLMMVMIWAYFSFSQLLIVWSGNLTDEIPWYIPRFKTSWGWVGAALIVVQFMIPFLLLLNRPLKRHAYLLSGVVSVILVMRYFDLVWIVLPGYYTHGFRIHWLDVVTPIGLGGLWLTDFLTQLPKRPLLPIHAPELEEALVHEST